MRLKKLEAEGEGCVFLAKRAGAKTTAVKKNEENLVS